MELKAKLEIAYYISGIIMAIVGLFGLIQLWLYKSETKTRFKRLSIDNSVKIIEIYYDFVKDYDTFCYKRIENNIPRYNGTIENPILEFSDEDFYKRMNFHGYHQVFNELDVIAASILCGTSNEKFIYNSIGKTILGTIASDYDLLLALRKSNGANKYYNNISKLFIIWRDKYIKLEMTDKKNNLENQINSIKDIKIQEIK